MTPQVVIFDFDFTLADSSLGIVECVGYALERLGFSLPPRQKIINTIGLPLAETFRQLTGETDGPLATRFSQLFHENADRVMDSKSLIYDSVLPVVRRLRSANLGTAIVSTKLHYRINNILVINGLHDLFDVIVGADDVANQKPDPEGILLAMRHLGVNPALAIYVGDHIVDAQAASNAGVLFIATLSGIHSRHSFNQYPCQSIIGNLWELPDVLRLSWGELDNGRANCFYPRIL